MNSPHTTTCEVLRLLSTLGNLSDSAIEKLAAIGELQTYSAGVVLFSEGDHHPYLYFVASGSIQLEMLTAEFGRQTILSTGPGDLLAWSSVLSDGIMTASAVVTEDAELARFETEEMCRLLDADPDLGYQVMKIIAQGLSRRLLATRLQLLDLYDH